MLAGFAIRGDRDPIGMRVVDVLVDGVRIGPRNHVHAQFAAARYQFTEAVAIAQETAAVVQRNLGGIIGHAAAGAQADGVAMGALEIIQPEFGVILAGVILDQRELPPAHGTAQRFVLGR